MRPVVAAFLLISGVRAQVTPRELNYPHTPGPSLAEIGPGSRVAWMTAVNPLGDPQRHNDFPSAAFSPNGDLWTVWSSYSGLQAPHSRG